MSVLIVAEIGINHNGNVETALELIDQAKWAGFDAVKFQKRNPEYYSNDLYDSPLFGRVPYREHKRRLELTALDFAKINVHCGNIGIEWFASCFDRESVDYISRYTPKYWKVASPCITDLDLVRYIGQQKGFVIMSTGMCTAMEMTNAVGALIAYKTYDEIALLHCCSEYPTPLEHINLNCMKWLAVTYPCKVGYSSHDAGVAPSVAAVGMGAEIIEAHITLDRTMKGSDHRASLEREEMERLVRHIRAVEKALGLLEKQFYPEEKRIREKVATKRVNS